MSNPCAQRHGGVLLVGSDRQFSLIHQRLLSYLRALFVTLGVVWSYCDWFLHITALSYI